MRNRKPDIKIRFQYREKALNQSYIRNTSDWLLIYHDFFYFRIKQNYYEFAALSILA